MFTSDSLKNGQITSALSGAGAINALDLVQTGGPGNQLWPVSVADRAAISGVSTVAPVSIVAGAVNNYAHWPSATDKLGNTYVLTPNASGQGVNASKYSPLGVSLISNVGLDVTASAMINMKLLALSNGSYAAVYAQASNGAVKFAIFDANLQLIAGPSSVATGYTTGTVTYIDACALSGSGFAVVYQNSAHTAIELQTYTNLGVAALAATSVQTISGTALVSVKIGQLSSGNLVIAMRTTAAPAGTSFVVVTTSATSIVANTIVDSTATAGFCELNILPGAFAVAETNGASLIVNVYNNTGVLQSGGFNDSGVTVNSTTYSQLKLTNDGTNFWFFCTYGGGGGLICAGFSTAGVLVAGTLSTLEPGIVTATASIDACISNGIAFVLAASTTTGGQSYFTIGLPNTATGIVYPYVLSAPVAIGSAAGTTGSYWPSCRALGDFSVAVIYDQQSTAGMFFGQVKFAASSIKGIAQNAVFSGSPGTLVSINPGPGAYSINQIPGTVGTAFDHRSVGGIAGTILGSGVMLGQISSGSSGSITPGTANPISGIFGAGRMAIIPASIAAWLIPSTSIRVRVWGGGGSSSGSGGGFAMKVISGLTVGATLALTVGAAGGTSSVGSFCSATGGSGSTPGTGFGGDVNYSGGSNANGGGAGGGAANLFGPGGNAGQSGASGGGGFGGGSQAGQGNGGGSGGSGMAGNGGSGGSGPTSGGVPTVGLSASSSVTGFSLDYIGAGGGGGGGGNGTSSASGAVGGNGENGGGGGGGGEDTGGNGQAGNGGFPGGGGFVGASGLIIIEW